MNIINKLTVRHLKENKRRTLVTIIGVIISVAMLTGVTTLGVSFLDLMKKEMIATDGEWHVQYKNVNQEQLKAIENDESTKELIISNDRGYAQLEGSENGSKPYLFIKDYNQQGLEQFPIALKEGRLPQAENEVVISEAIRDNANVTFEIGDQLPLSVGDRYLEGEEMILSQKDPFQTGELKESLQIESEETFTVVGTIERPTWEPPSSPGYTVISYMNESMVNSTNTVDVVVVLNKVERSLFKHSEELAHQHHIEVVRYNDDLLRLYGVTDNSDLLWTMYKLVAIIMSVIIIGSVSLIYNAFAISVSERSRHLGMLSSVGATKKQKRNSVFFEGAIIAAISIPVGIIAGFAGIAITFSFINSFIAEALNATNDLEVVVTPGLILVASGVSLLTIFISTYLPARKASKVSAIDAIRQSEDVKLSGKKVKTSKLVRSIFGMEAEIGLKNLKRNKRRYQITVFSLVVSIVLFLSVSFFTSNLEKSVELSQETTNYDILVYGEKSDEDELEPLTMLDYVTESSIVQDIQMRTWIDQTNLPEILQENVKEDESILEDGKYPYNIYLHGLEEENFQTYAELVGLDLEKLKNQENLSAIVINEISFRDPVSGRFVETDAIKAEQGTMIDLFSFDYESEETEFINDIEIMTLTDQTPMGIRATGIGTLDIVVSQKTIDELLSNNEDYSMNRYLYMNSSDPMATQEALEEVIQSDMYVYNVFQSQQRGEQMILLVSVFTYGFIALISAISVANIFNTISTSISLRKREFAMLKSVGMTPKGFNKMINYESIFYGVKALLYGLPISGVVMFLIYKSLQATFDYRFVFPWMSIIIVIVALFIIVSSAMLYSISKIKKENIIDGLKQENI
ncbi:cell division protein FtsX [Salipaludibacillus neizhouensis]|uniref:Cell division protein FtsX n=1 Tax=Salipaludibacillus neizhouensis TaxID=885475 RepID=A0A3A9K2K9_9BACI|nr:ABC transporter permease [Salipaludibacillus neizhouensis]RKL67384.1 cell division protein FtsX [Salipaludibacillus neizhouensis]